VADDVNACLEEGVSRPGVHVVRRHDRDRLYSAGTLRFGLDHAFVVVVDAVGRETERFARAARLVRSRGQRAGYQLVMGIEAEAMRCTAPMKAPSPPPT